MKLHRNILAYSGTVLTDNEIVLSTRKMLTKNFEFKECDSILYDGKYFDYDSSSFCGLYISMDIIKKIGLIMCGRHLWRALTRQYRGILFSIILGLVFGIHCLSESTNICFYIIGGDLELDSAVASDDIREIIT